MSNQQTDAFGVSDSGDYPDPQVDHTEADDQAASHVSDAKPRRAGLPMVAKIGLGVMCLFLLALIIMVVLNVVQRRTQSQQSVQTQVAVEAAAAELTFQQVVKNEIGSIKQSISVIQDAQAELNKQVAQLATNKPRETDGMPQRVLGVERAMGALQDNVKALAKRAVAERPFDVDLAQRDDARIVSIGNGIARVAMANGKEVNLQKGDKFNGLIVRELLSDRRIVVLSDGSVIL